MTMAIPREDFGGIAGAGICGAGSTERERLVSNPDRLNARVAELCAMPDRAFAKAELELLCQTRGFYAFDPAMDTMGLTQAEESTANIMYRFMKDTGLTIANMPPRLEAYVMEKRADEDRAARAEAAKKNPRRRHI